MKKILQIIFSALMVFLLTVCGKTVSTGIISNADDTSLSIQEKTEIVPGNKISESGIKDVANHSGLFSVSMSGYKGELFIGISEGKFYGTIKFYNWGNGVPQPLTDLKVTEDKIYFKRIIKTREEMIRYGGTDYFEQDFYGIFTEDNKTIKGYYRYIGTQDNWEAVKK